MGLPLPPRCCPLVKGQQISFRPLQPGGHVYIGQIHGKVNQHSVFELKNSVLACPVELVLLDVVGGVLPGELAFQLHGHHRYAVEK